MMKQASRNARGIIFIFPDGEAINMEDTGRMAARILAGCKTRGEIRATFSHMADICLAEGVVGAGIDYVHKTLQYTDGPEGKARACWAFGCLLEMLRDYEGAARVYAVPVGGPPGEGDAWYFVHNNLAYCLNRCGRHKEAELYCRMAIGISPERHNAHKNLGLALAGQGRLAEAARCFVEAVTRCPRDPRALHHLEDLVEENREAVSAHPDILVQLEECRRVVAAQGRLQ